MLGGIGKAVNEMMSKNKLLDKEKLVFDKNGKAVAEILKKLAKKPDPAMAKMLEKKLQEMNSQQAKMKQMVQQMEKATQAANKAAKEVIKNIK